MHPINVAVGGFYRAPQPQELRCLVDELKWGLEASVAVTRWVADFSFPDFLSQTEMVALRHASEYPMNEGRIVSTRGLDIAVDEFEAHFDERQVPHSTALQAVRLPGETAYFVGPLARVNLNREMLSATARQLSDEVSIAWPCFNPYQSIVARALEVVHAFEEALAIVSEYQGCAPARIPYDYCPGQGVWATEAPRGLIYHRYRINQDGSLDFAKIVPPTSQNQRHIELDLTAYLPQVLHEDDDSIARSCERLIRSYDPCISCATHFLKLEIVRR